MVFGGSGFRFSLGTFVTVGGVDWFVGGFGREFNGVVSQYYFNSGSGSAQGRVGV